MSPILYCDVQFTWDQANRTCSQHNATLCDLYLEEGDLLLEQLNPEFGRYQPRVITQKWIERHFTHFFRSWYFLESVEFHQSQNVTHETESIFFLKILNWIKITLIKVEFEPQIS